MPTFSLSSVDWCVVCCRFKEDRNLMALAGKGTSHSAGYREAPPEDD